MYAVIETGGKQYRVSEGDVITIEKLKNLDGDKVEFDKVILLRDDSGLQVGTPYLDAAKVYGSVVEAGKAKKVIIFKYKSKKDYRKKQGHRQPFMSVQIDAISADGSVPAKKNTAPKKAEVPAEPVEEKIEAAVEKPVEEQVIAVEKPAEEKKPAAKKATADKPAAEKKPAVKKAAADKPAAEKKPAAKKAAAEKPAAEKKPAAAKKAPAKKADEEKSE